MWRVCWILASPSWQRGYDLAMNLADDAPPARLANPFAPGRDEWYGFEEGRVDAEKVKAKRAG